MARTVTAWRPIGFGRFGVEVGELVLDVVPELVRHADARTDITEPDRDVGLHDDVAHDQLVCISAVRTGRHSDRIGGKGTVKGITRFTSRLPYVNGTVSTSGSEGQTALGSIHRRALFAVCLYAPRRR